MARNDASEGWCNKVRLGLMTVYTIGAGTASSVLGVSIPEMTDTLAPVMTQVATEVSLVEDTASVVDESNPGGVAQLHDGPWKPIRDPVEQLVEVAADEQEAEAEIRKRQLEQDLEAKADQDRRGAEVGGPEQSDLSWEASRARAERFGRTIDDLSGPQDRLNEANARLAHAERTKRQLAQDPRSSEAERLRGRLEAAEAQVELWGIQTEMKMAADQRLPSLPMSRETLMTAELLSPEGENGARDVGHGARWGRGPWSEASRRRAERSGHRARCAGGARPGAGRGSEAAAVHG